ncbi:unnamed protein product [Ilex paraguariensis]|uniref:Uncharacterized protein n=1 Tax=Ilex paraguariensis TaxID=185542 RepID=A0ABC8SAS1_9AQUA
MATTPSTTFSLYPNHNLPAESSIVEETISRHFTGEFAGDVSVPWSNLQKIVAELIGTYILIFAGCGAALVDRERTLTTVGIAMVWGLVLMALIYAVGHVSGAHFNPAVTLAFAASCRLPLIQVPMYVLSQLMGSTLACLTLRIMFHKQGDIRPTVTQYSSLTTDLEAITWEFLITFFLMFTICGVATDDRSNKALSGVAIGATVWFNVLIAGPITGASMNPARSIGPALISGIYKNLWVFIVAPILGAMAATIVYSVLRGPNPEKHEEHSKSIYNDMLPTFRGLERSCASFTKCWRA